MSVINKRLHLLSTFCMIEQYKILKSPSIDKFTISSEQIKIYNKEWLEKYSDEKYLYWDKIKHKPLPEWISNNEELWALVKTFRVNNMISPVKNEKGEYFTFWKLKFSEKLIYEIDSSLSWNLFGKLNKNQKNKLSTNWIIEEAISSSQLEWAATTTSVAKEMIQSKKKPRTKDEQMILNNYYTMNHVKSELVNKKITLEDLLELQEMLTSWTDISDADIWRFRNDDDKIVIKFDEKIAHVPPNEEFMISELQSFISFCNDEKDESIFIHPVIKAIIIHFWIGYLHPFCDWNWRTARALFYWYLLKHWYEWFSYIPLSKAIKKSKKAYAESYIYSEQDELDLNYFINYNLRKISISLSEFKKDLRSIIDKWNLVSQLVKNWFTERQAMLVSYLLEDNFNYTNVTKYMNYNLISKSSSINDLKALFENWYLTKSKSWRNINYFASDSLKKLISNNVEFESFSKKEMVELKKETEPNTRKLSKYFKNKKI